MHQHSILAGALAATTLLFSPCLAQFDPEGETIFLDESRAPYDIPPETWKMSDQNEGGGILVGKPESLEEKDDDWPVWAVQMRVKTDIPLADSSSATLSEEDKQNKFIQGAEVNVWTDANQGKKSPPYLPEISGGRRQHVACVIIGKPGLTEYAKERWAEIEALGPVDPSSLPDEVVETGGRSIAPINCTRALSQHVEETLRRRHASSTGEEDPRSLCTLGDDFQLVFPQVVLNQTTNMTNDDCGKFFDWSQGREEIALTADDLNAREPPDRHMILRDASPPYGAGEGQRTGWYNDTMSVGYGVVFAWRTTGPYPNETEGDPDVNAMYFHARSGGGAEIHDSGAAGKDVRGGGALFVVMVISLVVAFW